MDLIREFFSKLFNVAELLRTAGAEPEHLARVTWHITARKAYLDAQQEIAAAWREHFGTHQPAITVLIVASLLTPGALVEIEATAVLPS